MVDPFAGIGGGGIFAAPMGLKWRGVELEEKFCTLGQENFKLHYRDWIVMDYPLPVLVPGDSRRLSQVLHEADLICTSPPYAESLTGDSKNQEGICNDPPPPDSVRKYKRKPSGYGYSPNSSNIGNLKSGDLEAVIDGCVMSPPFSDMTGAVTGNNKFWEERKKIHGSRCASPRRIEIDGQDYGTSPGQIGRMKAGEVGAVVTSPPYEGSLHNQYDCKPIEQREKEAGRKFSRTPGSQFVNPRGYGQTQGNLGNESGDTYWQAVAQVYAECHKILKPGGVIIIVVKAYVKNGKRVPLPMQTLKLLIHLGFTPLERIKAMLVKETVTPGLFGEVKKVKERKSFFRRLAEKKGSPRIDFEEVLICRK